MTRAVWEAGLYPLLTQHEKMGLRTRCRLLEVAYQGAAVRHASRRFRDQDPQSRTRGEVLGVEVAVGHAVAQYVVARRNARGWSDVSRRSGRFPGQRPRTTGDRLPRAPPWSASTTSRWSMSRMGADLPYPKLRDAILAHPTMAEGLGPLFSNVPPQAVRQVAPQRASRA